MFRFSASRIALVAFVVLAQMSITACTANNPTSPTTTATPANSPAASPEATTANNPTRAKLNVNTATGPELLSAIPNFSNRMVHEFEEYRPYRSIQQFRKEIGKYVDQATIAEYEKFVFVPIDFNQSDVPTLMQIPGLDQSEAEALVAGRPYASPDAFITKLSENVSASELETARTYLIQK